MRTIRLLAALCVLLAALPTQAADDMKAFPAAEAGMVRHVLQLAKHDDESDFRLELIAGKMVEVDQGNKYSFAGKIDEETITGWGFSRYVVTPLGPLAGTLMAVDPNSPKLSRFITLGGPAYLIRYNSRLPIVVYAPEGVEVRYRVWRANPDTIAMDKG